MEPKWQRPLPLCKPPAPSAPNSSLPQQPHRPPPHPPPPPPPLLPVVSSSPYSVSYDSDIGKFAAGAVRPPSLQRLSCLLLRCSRPAARHLSLLTSVSSPYPYSAWWHARLDPVEELWQDHRWAAKSAPEPRVFFGGGAGGSGLGFSWSSDGGWGPR